MSERPQDSNAALLESVFRIRPGEARLVGLMFAYLLAIVSTFIIGRTVRDTLFLHRVSLEALPLMYCAVAVAVSGASWVYSRVADGVRRDRLVLRFLGLFALSITAFYLMVASGDAPDAVYAGLYVVVEVIGALSMIQFWTFAGDVFSGRQAKRLFGFIGAGGVLANVVCGFAVGALAPAVGTEPLLLVVAALFGVCALVVRAARRIAHTDLERAIQRGGRRSIGVARDGVAVLDDRHLKQIAALVAITFVTVTVVDYQFKVTAQSSLLTKQELASFFGNFYGVGGVIACLVQFFVTGRLIERSGIIPSLLVLPGTIGLGVVSAFVGPWVSPLFSATLAKGAENIFRYTVNDATSQLLYLPVPSHRRGRAKAFIDGILKPSSIGLAGLALYLIGREIAPAELADRCMLALLVLVLIWTGLVLSMKKAYVHSLLATLHDRKFDFEDVHWSPAFDEGTLDIVRDRLRSADDAEVRHALELVPNLDADLHEELEALLTHASIDIRVSALDILGRRHRFESIGAVRDRLHDPVPAIRAAAVQAFCAIGRERAIRTVTPHLVDDDLSVRGATCAALIAHSGLDGVLAAAESLKSLIAASDPLARAEGARVLARIGVRSFFHPVLDLLDDPVPRVRLAAIEAARAMRSPELVPALVYKLADRTCGRAAGRALASFGAEIEPTLFRVLGEKAEALEVRRQIPAVLGRTGGQRALDALIQTLETRDPELRATCAREAARIRERSPRVKTDELAIDRALRREARSAYQTQGVLVDLRLLPEDLLHDALQVRFAQKLDLAFRLLKIRYPGRTMRLVHANLHSDNPAVRANALEVLENTLDKTEARFFVPLLDDLQPAQRFSRGQEVFQDLTQRPASAWLPILLEDPHAWTVSCTLQLIATRGLAALEPHVAALVEHRDPIVRETAFVTLARLGEASRPRTDDLARLARAAAVDPVGEVRRAGRFLLSALGAQLEPSS